MNTKLFSLVCCSFMIFGNVLSADCCGDSCFSFKAEYLYWKACEDDDDYSTTTEAILDSDSLVLSIEETEKGDYKWNSGLRLGIIYRPNNCCCWNFGLEYTHFYTSGDHDSVVSFESSVTDLQFLSIVEAFFTETDLSEIDPFETIFFNESDFRKTVRLDILDLNAVSRSYYCGPVVFDFTFGLRGAYLQSKRFEDSLSFLLSDFLIIAEDYNTKWSFLGAGLRAAGEIIFPLPFGLSLFSNLSGSVLYGKMKTKTDDSFSLVVDEQIPILVLEPSISKDCYRVVPVLQGDIGLSWCKEYCGTAIKAMLAFEVQSWIHAGKYHRFDVAVKNRFIQSTVDVDFYGLTAGLEVAF